jgi:hypothetical protein
MNVEKSIASPGYAGDYLGDNLIFIISQPRSGSTLLQRILAGHPDIATSAETWLMLHPVYGTRDTGIQTDFNSTFAANAVGEFLDYYAYGTETYDRGIRAFAKQVYGEALERSGRRLFLDKTPRYSLIIPDLYRLFPRARFIFLLRHPMEVLYSELNTYVKGNWPKLAKFAPGVMTAPGRIMEGIRLLGDNAIVVRYAELVSDPERRVPELCQRLGLDYHPGMIEYVNTPAPKGVANDPCGIHKHKRPTTESIDRWKAMAGDPQLRLFVEGYLAALGHDLLAEMGYPGEEIEAVLKETAPSRSDGPLFPWRLSIHPESEWTIRDWFTADRYFATLDSGPVRGTLKACMRTGKRVLRLIRNQARAGRR